MSAKRASRKEKQDQAAPAAVDGETSAPAGSSGRLPWVLLGLVLMVSAVSVAGAFVSAPHNGGDNAGYVSLAYSLLEHGTYQDLYDPAALPHTKYPPVFPGLLALLMLLGVRTWTGLKLVAAFSTVAATAFTYLWAKRRLGPGWAVGVAVTLAFSSAVVSYSHWILSDMTFLAFTMAALWAMEEADADDAPRRWFMLALAAAALAYFTRSAGLPLLVALLGWLALRRRWRRLAVAAGALGIPALLWWLRARGVGDVQYVSEFWLVDPYDPGLGTVGIAGLAVRAVTNTVGYIGAHVPGGIVGSGGGFATAVGYLLCGGALVGWWLTTRRRPGPSELFFPLYAGLILLWPAVWSGDRFALPLYPLLLVFAATTVQKTAGDGRRGRLVAGAAMALLVLPALRSWTASVEQATACNAVVRANGPFACYGPGMTQFVEGAEWTGHNLPEGSVVMSRKPRIYYVVSGVPSRTFPFSQDPAVQMGEADAVGARYVFLDRIDGLASRWVGGAIQQQPGAVCHVQTFGGETGGGSQLLGFLPADVRQEGGGPQADGSVRIGGCPADYLRSPAEEGYASSTTSTRIPLLEGLDP